MKEYKTITMLTFYGKHFCYYMPDDGNSINRTVTGDGDEGIKKYSGYANIILDITETPVGATLEAAEAEAEYRVLDKALSYIKYGAKIIKFEVYK